MFYNIIYYNDDSINVLGDFIFKNVLDYYSVILKLILM